MTAFVKALLPEPNSFEAVIIGEFTTLKGIKPCQTWKMSQTQTDFDFDHLLRITLSIVHRLPKESYTQYFCSSMEDANFFMYWTICLHNETYYSICAMLQPSEANSVPSLRSVIYQTVQRLAMLTKRKLEAARDLNFLSITSDVISICSECSFVLGLQAIPVSYPIFLTNLTHGFLATVLTSHLQTQMTTIIELKTADDPEALFTFLSHFLLPYQLRLSSSLVQKHPNPFLYMQLVDYHRDLPIDQLMHFSRPWTWVRLSKQQVFQSPDVMTQQHAHEFMHANTFVQDGVVVGTKGNPEFARLRKAYNVAAPKPTAWAIKTIDKIVRRRPQMRWRFCESKLQETVHTGLELIELRKKLVRDGDKFFPPEKLNELLPLIGVNDVQELKAIVSVGQIFDKDLYRCFFMGAKEVFNQMLMTI